MRHLGDVTRINGYEIEPVDVLTGGSPCQDLSIAGLRKGLKHGELDDDETTRSGLFMEQIRIAKEMRERDRAMGRTGVDVRCRYFVWENVFGAYSSNSGRDFQTVLTEIIRVAEPEAPVVEMPDGGKWPNSGCFYSEMGRWSVAYRTVDAQWWGTPQRRRRIALVADFNGLTAGDILFDAEYRGETEERESVETVRGVGRRGRRTVSAQSKGLPGYFEPGGSPGEETAAGAEGGAGGAISFQERAGKPGGGKGILIQDERTGALSTLNNQSVLAYESNKELSGTVGFTNRGYESGETAETLRAEPHGAFPTVAYGIDQQGGKGGANYQKDKTPPILSDSHGTPHAVAYSIQGNTIDRDAKQNGSGLSLNVAHTIDAADRNGVFAVDVRNVTENPHINGTLQAKEQGISYNLNNVVRVAADVYNQTMDAETAPTVTAAVGGDQYQRPESGGNFLWEPVGFAE